MIESFIEKYAGEIRLMESVPPVLQNKPDF